MAVVVRKSQSQITFFLMLPLECGMPHATMNVKKFQNSEVNGELDRLGIYYQVAYPS